MWATRPLGLTWQGLHTKMAAIAAETFGIGIDQVHVQVSAGCLSRMLSCVGCCTLVDLLYAMYAMDVCKHASKCVHMSLSQWLSSRLFHVAGVALHRRHRRTKSQTRIRRRRRTLRPPLLSSSSCDPVRVLSSSLSSSQTWGGTSGVTSAQVASPRVPS